MMGPTLLFDKSFLQSLSLDEAVMLDQLFRCVLSPLFFVETMADLAKERKEGRDPFLLVSGLAERTPVAHSYMNTAHSALILQELLGTPVPMKRQPAMAGGIPVQTDGKDGVVFELSPEAEAFQRWQDGQFTHVERMTARFWRASLNDLDLPGIAKAFKAMLRKEELPRNHAEARATANSILSLKGQGFKQLMLAHEFLDMPVGSRQAVIKAWKSAGSPSLRDYAPYAAFCLEVDLYFYLAISNGIISDQRASNRRDIDYLFYLPFASIFVSGDRLHRAAGEQFLRDDQEFVWGPDLKKDLAEVNGHFLALPEEERRQGLFTLCDRPPIAHQGLCGDLWDRHSVPWRKPRDPIPELSREAHAGLIGRSEKMFDAARRGILPNSPGRWPVGAIDQLVIKRAIPTVRGSWTMFSPEIDLDNDTTLNMVPNTRDNSSVASYPDDA